MSNSVDKLNPSQIEELYRAFKPLALQETSPAYSHWALKMPGCMITAYQSGKVLFQGNDLSWKEKADALIHGENGSSQDSWETHRKNDSSKPLNSVNASEKKAPGKAAWIFPQAGSDEVGTGDYFGPIVVCAAIVPDEKTARLLSEWGVTDSKKMDDAAIESLGARLLSLLPCSVQILDNETYNKSWNRDFCHIKILLANMHNTAWNDLTDRHFKPDLCVIDQFCAPKTYFGYLQGNPRIFRALHFETRAESRYPAVAAASVIARYVFLQEMKKMEQKWKTSFPKGAGKPVDQALQAFVRQRGEDDLRFVAKLHFANTEKALFHTGSLF